MEESSSKVVLAYSGGLDTACILKTLIDRGHGVIAYVADVGQKEDFDDIGARALATGAHEVVVDDLRAEFVTDFIFPAIAGPTRYTRIAISWEPPSPARSSQSARSRPRSIGAPARSRTAPPEKGTTRCASSSPTRRSGLS